jgi:hypothetical protein
MYLTLTRVPQYADDVLEKGTKMCWHRDLGMRESSSRWTMVLQPLLLSRPNITYTANFLDC